MTAQETVELPEMETVDNLEFIRLKIPRVIPIELIEAVKGRTFSADQFYNYQDTQLKNPNNLLYALIDDQKKIQGYLWAQVNGLDGSLFVNTFSIAKKFWGSGKAVEKAKEFLKDLKDKVKAERVFWISSNPKFYKKHGFSQSKNVLLEYN